MSERTDKELALITTIKRHEYEDEALTVAENLVNKRNININEFVSESEITEYQKSLIVNKSAIPLTILEKVLSFLSTWIIYFLLRYILFLVSGIPINILSIISLPLTIAIQVYIFKFLKSKDFSKRAADFQNWVLNAYILLASLFLLERLMSFLFGA